MLEILYLSNYQYILYQDEDQNLYLNLTMERGFGVYDFCFQVDLSDKNDKVFTISEIEKLRTEYLEDPNSFSSKYSECKLDSDQTKAALNNWMTKN